MMRSKLLSIVVLPLVALTGCQQMERTGSAVGNFWNNLTGKTPLNAVKRMEDPYFADERRAGLNELSAKPFGRGEPYTARYQQIALTDKDFMVRVASIRALNRSRDASATSVFVRALDDENALVRTEAVKALSNLPDEAAIPKLIRMVNTVDEDRDVRIAAAGALKHYKRLDVARALISTLQGRDFGVAWQSRNSLVEITSKSDLRYDETEWLQYVTGPEKPFG